MFTHAHRLRHLLRPEHYTSAEHHARELTRLFRPAWHPVTTVDRLARPGDFLTTELLDHPLLLRNMDGELCCFLNVCAHRHSRITSLERGHSQELRCQYHGWEYNREGRTGRIPDAQSFRPWDRDNACLRKFRVETWDEMVFVCLDPSSPSLAEFLAPLPQSWGAAFAPPYRLAAAWHQDFPCNWKVVLENSLESYHVPVVHPTTFGDMPPEAACAHDLDERYTTFRTTGPAGRLLYWALRTAGQPMTGAYEHVAVHPHLTFVRVDSFRIAQWVLPTSPATSRCLSILYCVRGRGPLAALLTRCWQAKVERVSRRVFQEDAAIYEAVQRGLTASPFPGVIGAREERVHVFQRYVLSRCGLGVGEAEAVPEGAADQGS
jgi:phenylpropionate dioxygenase-like ring-hydroxylating dioxygenase large terminal subunit